MRDHKYYMALALVQAARAYELEEVPVGAVLVDESGSVIAEAYNSPISLCDPTAHAEIVAIRRAAGVIGNYRLTGTTLYVTLEPCSMCMGAILHARLKMVVYGTTDPRGGAAGSVMDLTRVPSLNHYVIVKGGILQEDCRDILQSFFKERRRQRAVAKRRGTEVAVTGSTRNRLVL